MSIVGNNRRKEKCTVNTVADQDKQEVFGESSGRVTKLKIKMYIEDDRRETVIPIL